MAKKLLRKLEAESQQHNQINSIQKPTVIPTPSTKTVENNTFSRKNIASNPAFVVGNGRSRLGINVENLLKQGIVYGCNAQYREYEPHYIVAVDVKMVNEIIASGYHKTHQVWTNPNKGITTKHNINFFSPHKGWSSGPTALWFAASQGHKEIFILGFDYQGLDGKFNNVYADTFNYKKSTDSATYFGNWLSQTEKVIKEFKAIKFYRVIEPDTFIPDKLGPLLSNLSHITVGQFQERFEIYNYNNQIDQKTTI